MKIGLRVALLSLLCARAYATTYYVSGDGADTNDGLADKSPFRTLQKAADLTQPGDTVLVMSGTYAPQGAEPVVHLSRSGTDASWITFKAAQGQHPVISVLGYAGILDDTASYIEINGFTVIGRNDQLTLDYAIKQKNANDARCNGNGIAIDGRNQGDKGAHHVRILNNVISKCGGAGIGVCTSDYVTIAGNRVFNNSWYTRWGTSGISVFEMRNSDDRTDTKIVIRDNITYGNHTLVPYQDSGKTTDGNGIIVDSDRDTHYAGRTLVTNNLSVNNGGSGMHAFHSDHVDFLNNTSWHNSQKQPDYGEIYAIACDDVKFYNNISVAADGQRLNNLYEDTKIVCDTNLFFGGLTPQMMGEHMITADPLFVRPKTDPTQGDFHLQSKSPAIGIGLANPRPDLAGTPRPTDKPCDLGAYQR